MPGETFAQKSRRRLLGLLLIAVIVGFITLSIAIYNKAFTPVVDVQFRFDHTGNSLLLDSDVKERGIIVGSVKKIDATGDGGAIVTAALEPSRTSQIPSNVSAQILPKTLFGEQYISLTVPSKRDAPIQAGDVVPQDRSKGALETEKVLGDLLPLLTAVDPADLNSTLTALATALNGRGNELGATLENFDSYLKTMNPYTARLADDLGKLGQVADEYNNVTPDLLASLKNLQTGARTLINQRAALTDLLDRSATTSNVLHDFLAANEQRLVNVTGYTNSFYGLLQRYSPEFSCMFQGINKLYELSSQAIYDHSIHLTITIDSNLKPYQQGNEPTLVPGYGPNCFGLPNNVPTDSKGNYQISGKYRCINDGAPLTDDPCAQRRKGTTATGPGYPSGTSASQTADTHALNSAAENAMVNTLISAPLHTTPNKVAGIDTVLAAPLLRGQRVVINK